MSLLISTVLFLCMASMYFGYFAVLYIMGKKGKWLMAIFLILSFGVYGLISIWGSEYISLLFPPILTSFVLPGLILLLGINKGWGIVKIYFYCHIPLICFAAYYYLNGNYFQKAQEALMVIADQMDKMKGQSDGWDNLVKQIQINLRQDWGKLVFGFMYREVSFRLIAGAFFLGWIASKGRTNLLSFKDIFAIKFPNWPIWVVIGLLTGLLISWQFPKQVQLAAISINLWWVLLPIYFVRGSKIIWIRFSNRKIEALFTFLLILLTLMFLEYMILGVTIIGLLNTWFEFKKPDQTIIDGR